VALIDPRLPGYARGSPKASRVFLLDAEAGTVSFGDGLRGARPAAGVPITAEYAVTRGAAGNVPAGAVRSGPGLPAGLAVANPLATWGGLDAESVQVGERMTAAFLRHRDRAVTAEDFRDLALRTPGTALARVDVLPAWTPGPAEPGSVAGAVTLMVVPAADPVHPQAPRPDARTLAAVCAWLDPRRLITTDVRVTGPRYRGLWISVALSPAPDAALAEVRQRVREALQAFLSPLPHDGAAPGPGGIEDITPGGWPARAPVLQAQLLAVVARVPGVLLVSELLVGFDAPAVRAAARLAFGPLELPEILGIAVDAAEAPQPLDVLKAATEGRPGDDDSAGPRRLPVPFIPDAC
jgi:predicted phage baseplate assembly protein